MAPLSELDRLVVRAQAGDDAALTDVLARARPLLVRHARHLTRGGADAEDAVQEVLLVVARRIGTYRRESSFTSWLYTVATRTILRTARPVDALALAEETLVTDHDPVTEGEWRMIEQDLHLACTHAVLVGLDAEARALYLLGDVLGVPDRVGAEVAGVSPAAYRKRLERARRVVAARARAARPAHEDGLAAAADELDALVRLGELHRAHGRPADAGGAVRALALASPTLVAAG